MAFENLRPHAQAIVAARQSGEKLTAIVDTLRTRHNVRTTAGTLSRFLAEQAPQLRPRPPTPGEASAIDATALMIEVLGEVRGRGEETRLAVEHLAGEVAVAREANEQLLAALDAGSSSARRKGLPAGFAFVLGLAIGAAGALYGAGVFV